MDTDLELDAIPCDESVVAEAKPAVNKHKQRKKRARKDERQEKEEGDGRRGSSAYRRLEKRTKEDTAVSSSSADEEADSDTNAQNPADWKSVLHERWAKGVEYVVMYISFCKRRLKRYLKNYEYVNYFRVHMLYIWLVAVIGGTILYFSQQDSEHPLAYIDAFFYGCSAVGQDGLVTADIYQLTRFGQVLLFLLMMLGSVVLISSVPLMVRIYYFRKRKEKIFQSRVARTEYGALLRLVGVPWFYWLLMQGINWLVLGVYVNVQPTAVEILETQGVDSNWFPFFETSAAFHQTGYSLFPNGAGFIPLQRQPFILLTSMFIGICGDIAFPINMRLLVWAAYKFTRVVKWRKERRYWKYILEHPRRCFPYLFPVRETLWLILSLVLITLVVFFILLGLEYNNTLDDLDGGDKFVNALFLTINARRAGFNTLPVASFRPATLVLLAGTMWVSMAPSVVLMRVSDPNQRVSKKHAEKDISGKMVIKTEPIAIDPAAQLGRIKTVIVAQIDEEQEIQHAERLESSGGSIGDEGTTKRKKKKNKRKKSARGLSLWGGTMDFLWRHTLYLFAIWVLICIVEDDKIVHDPNLSPFNILFEIISGYSGCGISIGYPNQNWSLTGALTTFSKFLMATVILLGRRYRSFKDLGSRRR